MGSNVHTGNGQARYRAARWATCGLAVAVAATLVVTGYNRYAATTHPARLFGVASVVSAAVLAGLQALYS